MTWVTVTDATRHPEHNVLLDVRMRNGSTFTVHSDNVDWGAIGSEAIIEYRTSECDEDDVVLTHDEIDRRIAILTFEVNEQIRRIFNQVQHEIISPLVDQIELLLKEKGDRR